MVDKDFTKITYEDSNGNVKGTFEKFQFASTGPSAPYNEGYGQNLVVKRETRYEKVPNVGFRAPLKIEQDTGIGDVMTKIAFTTPQTRKDQYGMSFAVKFLNETEKADASMSAFTDAGGVDTQESIKGLGAITVNRNTYSYFLVKVAPDTQNRTETTVQFNFTSSKLKNGKMIMEIYEGFTFNNFSDSDYTRANITTRTYPHQEDFDKHKFQDVMSGDVLLAGTKQSDGTVNANDTLRLTQANLGKDVMSGDIFLAGTKQNDGTVNANDTLRLTQANLGKDVMSRDIFLAGTKQNDGTVNANDTLRLTQTNLGKDVMSGDIFLAGTKQNDGTVTANQTLRLTGDNLKGAITHHMTVLLPWSAIGTNAWSQVYLGPTAGYPAPVFPCYGTGEITIHLLTHYFDDDNTIPTSNFTLQYRLIAYKESAAGLSRDYHLHTNINYTNEDGVSPAIKRSGDVFYLNRNLTYKPPADCIGYALELKQVKPTTSLGNESLLVCLLSQVLT